MLSVFCQTVKEPVDLWTNIRGHNGLVICSHVILSFSKMYNTYIDRLIHTLISINAVTLRQCLRLFVKHSTWL